MLVINREVIQTFIDGLITYDYMLFGAIFVIFILFLIIAILLRNITFLAVLFILLSFGTLIVAPFVGYIELHNYLFKNTITMTSQKRLQFTKAVVIKGTLKNESKVNFGSCIIVASAYKIGSNKYRNYLFKFKPFQRMSIIEENIGVGRTIKFKMIMEPFTYARDYNISLSTDCKGAIK